MADQQQAPQQPEVSVQTIAVTGILVDIYGLAELPTPTTHVSVLWLHNPRLGDRSTMAKLARRVLSEYHQQTREDAKSTRGLIAAAFDQRNHGSREVHPLANQSWSKGNPHHAQDMFGLISGTVVDTGLLIDALPGYLFLDQAPPPVFDQHLCAGISLGGHSTWQTMFVDPRVTAGVSIIGCPDYQFLLSDRARRGKLPTAGPSFLGSSAFPPALVEHCEKFDPKAIVLGDTECTSAAEAAAAIDEASARVVLNAHVRGKRFLLCSGAEDRLVPWRCSAPFVGFLERAASTWYRDGGLGVDSRVYPGIGHECSPEMEADAAVFVCEVVRGAKTEGAGGGSKM